MVSFRVQSPAAAAELQNKMLQYSILQFWKQLGEKVQRDFFDKLRPRCGCSGAVGDIAYSAVTIWPLTSAKRTPSFRLIRLLRSFSVSV